jgi:hypothetical protein
VKISDGNGVQLQEMILIEHKEEPKSYRLYNPVKQDVVVSRDVKFCGISSKVEFQFGNCEADDP